MHRLIPTKDRVFNIFANHSFRPCSDMDRAVIFCCFDVVVEVEKVVSSEAIC